MTKRYTFCFILVLAIALCTLAYRQQIARGDIILSTPPPSQLTIGEHTLITYSVSPHAKNISAHSSNTDVANIKIDSVEGGSVTCSVTAIADGSTTLSILVGKQASSKYSISVVPPVSVPLTDGPYVSSLNSNKFHLNTCVYAKKIQDKNKVYFETETDATKSERTPCAKCLPKQ